MPSTVLTPKIFLLSVWPLPRSLATTSGISVDFFSSPYLDVSVQAVPLIHLCIQCMMSEYCSDGFPHSEIHGSMAAFASPWLIADRCVLRRLLVPRHSPCALCSLTFFLIFCDPLNDCYLSYFTRWKCILITLFFFKNTMTFQDGRHSILSLVLSFITLFSFQGAIIWSNK